jgi:hypothetical protein
VLLAETISHDGEALQALEAEGDIAMFINDMAEGPTPAVYRGPSLGLAVAVAIVPRATNRRLKLTSTRTNGRRGASSCISLPPCTRCSWPTYCSTPGRGLQAFLETPSPDVKLSADDLSGIAAHHRTVLHCPFATDGETALHAIVRDFASRRLSGQQAAVPVERDRHNFTFRLIA